MLFKKEFIEFLSNVPSTEEMTNNKIILSTAIGLITGRLSTDDEYNDPKNVKTIIEKLSYRFADDYKEKLSLSATDKLPAGEGWLYLVDVEIKSANYTHSMPFMIVFLDQIIGISLGNN